MRALKRFCAQLRRSDEGASFVELAVVLPVLALLVIGLIETGRWMAFGIRLGNAAHAGAAYGAQSQGVVTDSAGIASAACNDSAFSCTTSTPKPGQTASPDTMFVTSSVTCAYSDGTSDNACPLKTGVTRNMFVHVSTSGTFKPLLKYPYMSNSIPMSATAVLQVTQ
jgi:Flp pilus assembly protein TadG